MSMSALLPMRLRCVGYPLTVTSNGFVDVIQFAALGALLYANITIAFPSAFTPPAVTEFDPAPAPVDSEFATWFNLYGVRSYSTLLAVCPT